MSQPLPTVYHVPGPEPRAVASSHPRMVCRVWLRWSNSHRLSREAGEHSDLLLLLVQLPVLAPSCWSREKASLERCMGTRSSDRILHLGRRSLSSSLWSAHSPVTTSSLGRLTWREMTGHRERGGCRAEAGGLAARLSCPPTETAPGGTLSPAFGIRQACFRPRPSRPPL